MSPDSNLGEAIRFLVGLDVERVGNFVSDECVKRLKAIDVLLRNHDTLEHFYLNEELMTVDFLIALTNLLSEHCSLTAIAAQYKVFYSYFADLIPDQLKGFENIWMHVFEYHRFIEGESREVCCLVCTILSKLFEYKDYRDRNGVSSFEYPIERYLTESSSSADFLLQITKAVDRYRCDSAIISWGTSALIYLVLWLEDNGDMGMVHGALSSIVSTLELHMNDVELVNNICNALNKVEGIRANIFKHLIYPPLRADKILVRVLHQHTSSTILCANALRIIAGLLEERDCSIQDRFMESGVDKHVIALVTSHPLEAGIAVSGCAILLLLAEKSAENKRMLGQNGACEAAVIAFSHHSEFRSYGLCRPLIRSLAYSNIDNKNKLLQLGASDWVPQLNVSGWLDGSESEQGGDY